VIVLGYNGLLLKLIIEWHSNDIILVIPVHNKKVKFVYTRRIIEIIGEN